MHKRCFPIIVLLALVSLLIVYTEARTSSSIPYQTKQECPKIIVECPTEFPEEGKTYTVTAKVENNGNKKLTYNWSFSSDCGEIVEGQGTASIKIYLKCKYHSTTAMVEVCGLEDKCQKKAYCSFPVS
jgi:hypothetical protein